MQKQLSAHSLWNIKKMNKADQVKNSYAVMNNEKIEEDLALPNDDEEKIFFNGFNERLRVQMEK